MSGDSSWRSRRRRGTLLLLLALGAAIVPVTMGADRLDPRRGAEPPERVLYLPRDKGFQVMCLGYDGLAADLVWIRGTLYAGRKLHDRDRKYEWLNKLYQVATDLDPHWTRPYTSGAILLSALPQDDARAIRLLDKGLRNNPGSYDIPFVAAQLLLLRGRNREALRYLDWISRGRPGKYSVVDQILERVRLEGNDYRGALTHAAGQLAAIRDPVLREAFARNYREALARLAAEELTGAWAAWRQRAARPPADLAELIAKDFFRQQMSGKLTPLVGARPAAEFIKGLPRDPFGMKFYLRADGTIRSAGLERVELLRRSRGHTPPEGPDENALFSAPLTLPAAPADGQ